jgi:hypothetical protein
MACLPSISSYSWPTQIACRHVATTTNLIAARGIESAESPTPCGGGRKLESWRAAACLSHDGRQTIVGAVSMTVFLTIKVATEAMMLMFWRRRR